MPNTGTKTPPDEHVQGVLDDLTSDDPDAAYAAVENIMIWIDLGFSIPPTLTDAMVERLKGVDHLTLDVTGPDSEMIKVLTDLGIEIPAYEDPGPTDYEVEQLESPDDGMEIPGA